MEVVRRLGHDVHDGGESVLIVKVILPDGFLYGLPLLVCVLASARMMLSKQAAL